jgi:hypothetical protein
MYVYNKIYKFMCITKSTNIKTKIMYRGSRIYLSPYISLKVIYTRYP